MKPKLSEAAVAKIMEHLLERFGDPIGNAQGDGQGVPSSGRKEKMGNRGFGAKLEGASPSTCDQCGGMMDMDGSTCSSCGKMPPAMGGAAPAGGEKVDIVVVKGGAPGGPGGKAAGGGRFAQGLTVKDMDGIPSTGSGRGTEKASAAPAAPAAKPVAKAPALPKPMPAEMGDGEEEEVIGEDESESEEDAQERLHFDLDHDGERGEPMAHREKVLGKKDAHKNEGEEMKLGLDEDDAGGSSPPPSGGSSGGSSPPPPPPKPPTSSPPPSGGSSGGGSSPPPSGGSSPPPSSNQMDEADLAGAEDECVGMMETDMDLDEVTPPGREKQVKALKKDKNVDNPWAVAWSSYNKSHKKK